MVHVLKQTPRIWKLGASLCLETIWLALCASLPSGDADDELHPLPHGLPGWEMAGWRCVDGWDTNLGTETAKRPFLELNRHNEHIQESVSFLLVVEEHHIEAL